MNKIFLFLIILFITNNLTAMDKDPVKIGIIGLSHSHVHWILGRANVGDFEIVGIVETDTSLANRYMKSYGLNSDLLFEEISNMIEMKNPEAVTAYGPIYDHLKIVEVCAPLGIHVMVEKPLAANLEHANKMKELAEKYNIHLITNYETTWYPSNHKVKEIITEEQKVGGLRKVVVHDGHEGPKEIGVNKEFLDWLTDPKLNGGGAIIDFGCYGANLITWLVNGEKPISVTALMQQIKPEVYPNVDDEATIILEYPKMQGIIQASWNWPFSRKDMEIYGVNGFVISENKSDLKMKFKGDKQETKLKLKQREKPYSDPFYFFSALIRNETKIEPYDLSSLENNMIVMEILDAAIRSAKSGKRIYLDYKYPIKIKSE